jgi:hypothetical protein
MTPEYTTTSSGRGVPQRRPDKATVQVTAPATKPAGQNAEVRPESSTPPQLRIRGAGTKEIRMQPPLANNRRCTRLWMWWRGGGVEEGLAP